VKAFLLAVALAAVLAFGLDGEPVAAPPPAVPLAVSETTPPPGWAPPAELTVEEELLAWIGSTASSAAWDLVPVVIGLVVVLGWAYRRQAR